MGLMERRRNYPPWSGGGMVRSNRCGRSVVVEACTGTAVVAALGRQCAPSSTTERPLGIRPGSPRATSRDREEPLAMVVLASEESPPNRVEGPDQRLSRHCGDGSSRTSRCSPRSVRPGGTPWKLRTGGACLDTTDQLKVPRRPSARPGSFVTREFPRRSAEHPGTHAAGSSVTAGSA